MSGGTPTAGGGYMRQRFNQGYYSSGDDLEDDACSTSPPLEFSLPMVQRARNWYEVLENFIWIVSAAFIVYYGDWEANFISILWGDGRIRRSALHLGLATAVLNVGLIIHTIYFISSLPPKSHEKSEALSSAAPFIMMLGILSFCLFSYALWPIWSVLTIPLLFTLVMASVLISPYLLVGPLRPQSVVLRAD